MTRQAEAAFFDALDVDQARLESLELVPFRRAIEAGVDSVMTAHIAVPQLTGDTDTPATLSERILKGLLRESLHFDGLVVTDALEMGGMTTRCWAGAAAVRALKAGADMLLLTPDTTVALNEVLRAVRRGEITEQQIEQSARKVLEYKSRLGLQRRRNVPLDSISSVVASPESPRLAQEIADRSITLVMIIASTLLLVAILISACEQPYFTPPAVTSTPLDNPSLFINTPLPNEPGNMQDMETIPTQTASASVATRTPDANAPAPASGATTTPTIALIPSPTATQAVVAPTSTSASTTSKGGTYIMKNGEFPYCIARRFNVDPDEILALNGLSDAQMVYPGLVLKIPQSGNPFPGDRMLQSHPTTYTVVSSSETRCWGSAVHPPSKAASNPAPPL